MAEELERLIVPDEDGEEHLFDVLFTFDIEETGQSYITLIPSEQNNEEEVEVYAFRYEEEEKTNDDSDVKLMPIESDEEWDMVEEMIYTLSEENDLL